jgi:PAS domain S-box-containing protein
MKPATPKHSRTRAAGRTAKATSASKDPTQRSDVESSYKLLFEAAPDAILVVGPDGVIRRNNAEAERLLDAASGELIGLAVEQFVPLASRNKHRTLRKSYTDNPHKRPMGIGLSLQAIKLSGREFPVEISLASTREGNIANTDGEIIVVLRDVSERVRARRTERELVRARSIARVSNIVLRERELERALQETTQVICEPLEAEFLALFLLKPEVDLLSCVAASGIDAARIDQTHFSRTDADWLAETLTSASSTLVGDIETADVAWPVPLRNAGARSLMFAPLNSHERGNGFLIAGCRDPHRFSTDDLAYLEAVANIVSNAIRRHDTEERLLLSQRLESLGQLTGGVAHDFNNLLTVMSGNLQILAEMDLPDEYAHRAIAAALRSTQRGTELTSRLLAFSRRQTLQPQPIDVAETLGSLRDLLLRTLGENIRIEVNIAADVPKLVADRGQLETALLNLAVNARDAMPKGGTLTIDASLVSIPTRDQDAIMSEIAPGRYVCISVADTGEGMSRDTIARAFEPFFTTKAPGKGSGLGLSMVYGFAKQSAGQVNAYSELGIGTTINLYLPATEEMLAATGKPVRAKRAPQSSDFRARNNETILIVEDDAAVCEVAIRFLQALGYRTHAAANQTDAVTALKAHSEISMVFTDVVLAAGETGPRVVEALRQQRSDLPVLYTSGYAKSALPLEITRESEFDFLRKPYSREQLGQAIRTALSRANPKEKSDRQQRARTAKSAKRV